MSSSSNSATRSMRSWWPAWAASTSSAGMSSTVNSVPSVFEYVIAFISTRSTIPEKCSSSPIGTWIGTGRAPRRSTHRLHGGVEVGARAVHLVDERDARNAVAVGLAPDGLGLRLHPCDGVEDGDRAVEDAKAPLDLDGKVHVPGRIDDVDAMVAPLRGRRRRRDGDAALLLLRHPVHRRGALVHLAHLVGATGVVEDPLGRRGLARVDVGHDPDVADAVEPDRCGYGRHLVDYQR